jgi:siroheme synthase (precorrin-2 oxidase/ferrochelatase)
MSDKPTFLVALRLDGERALVVGSDPEAAYRAKNLGDAGAVVRCMPAEPDESDLDGVRMVVVTGADAELARRVATRAKAKNALFCAIDQPAFNSFDHVAIARAGRVSVAVSTGRAAPALAKKLKEEFERLLVDSKIGEFAASLARLRERTPSEKRRELLGRAVAAVRLSGRLEIPQRDDTAE